MTNILDFKLINNAMEDLPSMYSKSFKIISVTSVKLTIDKRTTIK